MTNKALTFVRPSFSTMTSAKVVKEGPKKTAPEIEESRCGKRRIVLGSKTSLYIKVVLESHLALVRRESTRTRTQEWNLQGAQH